MDLLIFCFLVLLVEIQRPMTIPIVVSFLKNPFNKLHHFAGIFNHHKGRHFTNIFRAVDVLVIFDLLKNDVNIDHVVAFSFLIVPDNFILKRIVFSSIENSIDHPSQFHT